MATKPYLPAAEGGLTLWFDNFAVKLPDYQVILDLTPADVTFATDAANFVKFIIPYHNQHQDFVKNLTMFKQTLLYGPEGTPLGDVPQIALPVSVPAPMQSGLTQQIRRLVQRIKNHNNYNDSIGQNLGIIGEEDTTDINTLKPKLTVEFDAGRPLIKWKKSIAGGIKIYVDRDGNGFKFLAIDLQPDYLDTFALPPAGSSALWKYRVIYVDNDGNDVGQWSDVFELTVKGAV